MKEIGLYPSSTGKPGGKETGNHVGNYVVAGEPFARALARFQTTGFKLRWRSRTATRCCYAARAARDDGGAPLMLAV